MNFTAEEKKMMANSDVLGHIRANNARRNERAIAEGWTFWTTVSEDIAKDYANVYDYEHSMTYGEYSDFYKEVHGIRPRWIRGDRLTLSDLQGLIRELSEASRAAAEAEARWLAEVARQEAERAEAEVWRATVGVYYEIQDALSGVRGR